MTENTSLQDRHFLRNRHVTLHEVGPRDGLQNEPSIIAAEQKIKLVDMLSATGLAHIEAASFVSPKWVPQMASSQDVMRGIARRPGISYSALTPNLRGYDMARETNCDQVAVFASASEGVSQKNINCSVAESLGRFEPIFSAAKSDNIPVRAYISCVVECPYDGKIAPDVVAKLCDTLKAKGAFQVSLGDTIGKGTPDSVSAVLKAVLQSVPAEFIAGHFHATTGRAMDNIASSLELGIRSFDSAVGGLGGCPYAPGAKGNVATEAVLAFLHQDGWATGLDSGKIAEAALFAKSLTAESSIHD